jgi:hypothetical protein
MSSPTAPADFIRLTRLLMKEVRADTEEVTAAHSAEPLQVGSGQHVLEE